MRPMTTLRSRTGRKCRATSTDSPRHWYRGASSMRTAGTRRTPPGADTMQLAQRHDRPHEPGGRAGLEVDAAAARGQAVRLVAGRQRLDEPEPHDATVARRRSRRTAPRRPGHRPGRAGPPRAPRCRSGPACRRPRRSSPRSARTARRRSARRAAGCGMTAMTSGTGSPRGLRVESFRADATRPGPRAASPGPRTSPAAAGGRRSPAAPRSRRAPARTGRPPSAGPSPGSSSTRT